jgi:hypothetical protein
VVAHLGNEKFLGHRLVRRLESILAAVGRIHLQGLNSIDFEDAVALDPGAVVTLGNIVFFLTGAHAASTADALLDVHQHAPPVLGHVVVGRGFRRAGENVVPCDGRGRQQNQKMAASDVHLFLASTVFFSSINGLWGW